MDETNKGFMKHLGGLELKQISDTQYEFIVEVKEMHLNTGKIAHGGFLSTIADSGMGTAAHQNIEGGAVTISMSINFIGGSKPGDEIIGYAKIKKQTRSLVFMYGELKCNDKLLATAEGIWKILK